MGEQSFGREQDPHFTQRFSDAVASVQEYNSKHTGISHIAQGLFSMFRTEEEDQPAVSPTDQADMEKELVALLQADELEAMGVTLFDSKEPGIKKVEFTESETGDETEGEKDSEFPSMLVMLITDADKFTDTVYKLNPTPEQQKQVESGINTILSSAVGLIEAAYPYEKPDSMSDEAADEAVRKVTEDQINMFMELNTALVAQGLDGGGACKKMQEYTARYAAGTLADYREAEKMNLLQEAFGPAQWPMDANPEFLNSKWSEAFSLLRSLRDREKPSPYFTELFMKLRTDFDKAVRWLESEDTRDERKLAYIEPLGAEMSKLSKVWEEDFPLENSLYSSPAVSDQD